VVCECPVARVEGGLAGELRDPVADGQRADFEDERVDLGVQRARELGAAQELDVLAVLPLGIAHGGHRVVGDQFDGRVRALGRGSGKCR
jgi:hypothetical protein